jgi:hypothetical protein
MAGEKAQHFFALSLVLLAAESGLRISRNSIRIPD